MKIVNDGAAALAQRRQRMVVSRRQLLDALARAGFLTAEQALAAARTGEMPPPLATLAESLPDADRLSVEITWATMTQAERLHPLVDALAAAQGATPAEIDAFFELAASL
jgi:hypothetical protein